MRLAPLVREHTGLGNWIQVWWPPDQINRDITWKELFAITSAVNTWGHQWPQKKILVYCDNQTVVGIWKKGTTKCPKLMTLVHMLYFCVAQYNIHVLITHVAGTDNSIADVLSHFQVCHFRQLAPRPATNLDTTHTWSIQLLRDPSVTTNL